MHDVETRVEAGIKWLDANAPEDWRTRVDLDTLDLASNDDCVLGQVFGSYADVVTRGHSLHLELFEREAYGFTTGLSDDVTFEALTMAWALRLMPLPDFVDIEPVFDFYVCRNHTC